MRGQEGRDCGHESESEGTCRLPATTVLRTYIELAMDSKEDECTVDTRVSVYFLLHEGG